VQTGQIVFGVDSHNELAIAKHLSTTDGKRPCLLPG
jgi:hypothetical protein